MSKNEHYDTNFLRCLAIVLILNSHLDAFYPIQYIGTGGAIGNSLFFALSSFGLYLSENKNPKSFVSYFSRRISRIYPSVWISMLLLNIPMNYYFNRIQLENLLDSLSCFFYPPFWFLQILLFLYPLIYFLIKKGKKAIVFSIVSLCYLIVYLFFLDLNEWVIEELPFKVIFYILIALYGLYLAENNEKIRYKGLRDGIVLFFLVFIIYFHKFLMTKNLYPEFQIIQQILIFPVVLYFFKISRSKFVFRLCSQNNLLRKIILFFSAYTLEIYIVHENVGWLAKSLNFIFPFNVLVFFILILIISVIIKKIAKHLSQHLINYNPVGKI